MNLHELYCIYCYHQTGMASKHFLQICGTAIGTKAAPGFCCNYVGVFENKFVYTYHQQPLVWLRYIDDIFLIWTHTVGGTGYIHRLLE